MENQRKAPKRPTGGRQHRLSSAKTAWRKMDADQRRSLLHWMCSEVGIRSPDLADMAATRLIATIINREVTR